MIKTIQYLVSRFLKHLEPPSLTITFRSGRIWYGPGRISSDFRPKHAMLTLHVWFLHKRLINSTEHNKHFSLLVQEELFDILWHDTRLRIRAEGVNELSVEKHVKDVQQYTFQQLCHLDHAYTEEFLMDEKKRLEEVAFLVWHHMLGREEDVTDDQLQRLVLYIDLQLQNVLWKLPERYWNEGRIGWINIPNFDNMRDSKGNLLPNRNSLPADHLPKNWETAMTLAGKLYYYNTKTLASQWEKP